MMLRLELKYPNYLKKKSFICIPNNNINQEFTNFSNFLFINVFKNCSLILCLKY